MIYSVILIISKLASNLKTVFLVFPSNYLILLLIILESFDYKKKKKTRNTKILCLFFKYNSFLCSEQKNCSFVSNMESNNVE